MYKHIQPGARWPAKANKREMRWVSTSSCTWITHKHANNKANYKVPFPKMMNTWLVSFEIFLTWLYSHELIEMLIFCTSSWTGLRGCKVAVGVNHTFHTSLHVFGPFFQLVFCPFFVREPRSDVRHKRSHNFQFHHICRKCKLDEPNFKRLTITTAAALWICSSNFYI